MFGRFFIVAVMTFLVPEVAIAGGAAGKKVAQATTQKPADDVTKEDDLKVTSKTRFDFNEAMIDGQMQAPSGFFLQGRNQQDMTQMVKLRSHFKSELRNSKSAVKALAR